MNNPAVVFVCQNGELEIKASLLAASLRVHLEPDQEIVAAIPTPASRWGEVSSDTLEFLESLGVRVSSVINPVSFDYPIANKIPCFGVDTAASSILFLDTDIICLESFVDKRFDGVSFAVKTADLATAPLTRDQWKEAYAVLDVPPNSRLVRSTISSELFHPYFNSGVILSNRGEEFALRWGEFTQRLYDAGFLKENILHLDQVALPPTIDSFGEIPWVLSERMNFPAHLRPLESCKRGSVKLCHYHGAEEFGSEPQLRSALTGLLDRFPSLEKILNQDPAWARIVKNTRNAIPKKSPVDSISHPCARNVVVTGIPRSGTSYFCSLLDRINTVVGINEPDSVFPALRLGLPWSMDLFLRNIRWQVLSGQKVRHKAIAGRVIEDTNEKDVLEEATFDVNEGFTLVVKNTLAFLGRLDTVDASKLIVGCVRHPADSIASWKNSFRHLRDGRPEDIPIGGSDDHCWTIRDRVRLREIVESESASLRRALWWTFQASILLRNRHRIMIVRYEDWIDDPAETIQKVCSSANVPPEHLHALQLPRSKRKVDRTGLTDEDWWNINAICGQAASEFGYEVAPSQYTA